MNPNEQMNQNPETNNQQEEQFPAPEGRSMGVIFGSIIVVIVLLVAAFYLWGNNEEKIEIPPENNVPEEKAEVPLVVPEENLGAEIPPGEENSEGGILEDIEASDELDNIMEDLGTTDLDDLTSELDDIEKDLGL